MNQVLLFAGTIEGRKIAEYLSANHISVYACVATEYGKSLLPKSDYLQVSEERLNAAQMAELMNRLQPEMVVDATHPYAAEVTANIRKACEETGCVYQRLLRAGDERINYKPGVNAENSDFVRGNCDSNSGSNKGAEEEKQESGFQCMYVESTQEAAKWLSSHEGNALLTTGSKELAAYTVVPDFANRLYARVLSLPKVMEQCAVLGFTGAHLIGMQGPFSTMFNRAMIQQLGIRYLVTKDTGTAGGFPEKMEAAELEGITLVVIGRPVAEQGLSYRECKHMLAEHFSIEVKPQIAVVGIGMGGEGSMTVEADAWCRSADLIVGASRMVEAYADAGSPEAYTTDIYREYRANEICSYINSHPEYEKIAILLSGDVGFYSGAKKLLEMLPENTIVYPGIASVVAFCAKLKVSWDDLYLTSAHGKNSNLVGCIRHNHKVFSLLGKENQVQELCKKLMTYGMDDVTLFVGTRISYEDEVIQKGTPADFVDLQTDTLSVLYVENPRAKKMITHGTADAAFLRDKVPMTKEEVREVSICKMHLRRDSVIYDIGAGSGSLSVEMADLAWEGEVYAIEKKETAVELLRKNKERFAVDNMTVVAGLAPEALTELPAPTHAFIGGSSGNLKEICELLLEKNPDVRIVINAITLETVGEALAFVKEYRKQLYARIEETTIEEKAEVKTEEKLESYDGNHRREERKNRAGVCEPEIVQITSAGAKQAGPYHLMMGQNPVYIISFGGVQA